MVSLRPRITFKKGVCNACRNYKIYKKIDWKEKFSQLLKIANQIKKENKNIKYNCIVPSGGGKDSSYVAWHVKNTLGLKPLCVFCEPPLFTKLGKRNLEKFEQSGFKVIKLKFNDHFRSYDRKAFVKMGLPQQAWLTAITIFPIKVAKKYGINYIFGGEEAESLYGGSNKNFMRKLINIKDQYSSLLENQHLEEYFNKSKLNNFKNILLKKNDLNKFKSINKIYWSNFEFWDEQKHFKIAQEKCGMIIAKKKQTNSINKHSHLDQKLYALHMFIAYLKFGFSRATTDTSIAIRLGYMTRKNGLSIVNKYDNIFPSEFLKDYLKYFNLSKNEFFSVLKKHLNRKIFQNDNIFNLKLKKH